MTCPRCQAEIPSNAEFCPRCGGRLVGVCVACRTLNAPDDRFCKKCGKPLIASAGEGDRRAPEAERRQLTVMFCDLVGSTALSERLDPEDLRTVLRAYQAACAEVVERFEGNIAQYLGDGVLAYFGYPEAHEDDPQRAVRAGLDIVRAIGRLGPDVTPKEGIELAARVGIHTGLVVVGEVGGGSRHERLALGETPNLAARIQALAAPGAVLSSATTQRLVQGLFVFRDLGAHAVRGVSGPVRLYEVVSEAEARSRLDVAGTAGLTPLVGREQEAALLLQRWDQVVDGRGHVVVLSGEAGIGKSRLVQMMTERLAGRSHLHFEARCSPYYRHSPLYPVIDLLPRALEWRREDSADTKLQALEDFVARYPVSVPDAIPLLASLLSLPAPDRYPALVMSPERQKQKTQEALVALLLAMAAERPMLLVVEDLHWIDPSTLEWLTRLLDQVPTARLLTLLTVRPPFDPSWAPRSHLIHLMLDRLTRRQTELMVGRVAGGKILPAQVLEQIVTKTDGVPLFVEELTKMVLESGLLSEHEDRYELTGPLPALAIPSTLQDSLTARLDRLAVVKEVAQLGATLGRSFPYELLRAVSSLDEETLERELDRLVEAELLYQRGVPPQATYTFKHALVQEAAYQSLLKSTRQRYHGRIAQILVERFSDIAETRPEFVAHHFTEAGLGAPAVGYWQRAARRDIERSAAPEAIAHATRGLEVLSGLPESPERVALELGLLITIGLAWQHTKGWASPEMERTYTRAHELCREIGDTPQLVPALGGLYSFFITRGELATATELALRLLALGRQAEDTGTILFAQYFRGVTAFYRGDFVAARALVTESLGLYDFDTHRSLAFSFGADGGVLARAVLAHTLWALGYPDQGLEASREMLRLARKVSHPFTLAWAVAFAAWHRLLRGEWQAAQEHADAAATLAAEQSFPFWSAVAGMWRGAALAQQGRPEEGIELQARSNLAYRAMGAEIGFTHTLAWLADAHRGIGRVDEGLQVVGEALALVDKNDEHGQESELYRLRGELLLIQPVPDEPRAEACFRRAVGIARGQHARSLELRAALSLARLLGKRGLREEASLVLAEVYRWFTEGWDTADLRAARTLLDELSAPR